MRRVVHPDRRSWLLARSKSLGGTDAASICGVGFDSPYTVWAEKCGLLDAPEGETPEYLEAGQFLEPGIIAWWSHRTGLVADPTPLVICHDEELPMLHASPDALVGPDEGLDAKNASSWRAADWEGELPLKAQVQAQHYMGVTGRVRWHFAAAIGGNRLRTATVERNEKFIAALRTRLADWWSDHVVAQRPPEPDGSESTTETIKRVWGRDAAPDPVPLSAEIVEIHEMLRAAKGERKTLNSAIAEFENKIKAALGEHPCGILPGGLGEYRWKTQERKGYVVKPTTSRPLKFVAPKGAPGGDDDE